MDATMLSELETAWRDLDDDPAVHVIVNTGEGTSFQTGLDVVQLSRDKDALREQSRRTKRAELRFTAWHNQVWKPVIAAVNGMACGGAFYILGESDIIIATDDATFFDPHVTYGMTSSFESMHMLQRMPLGEVLRMQLLGNYERMSAQRAHQIGLVSEIVARDELNEAAAWVAETIASQPPLAVQGTLRAIWAAQDLPRAQALAQAFSFVKLGTNADSLREGQRAFESGARPKWRLR
jgi:enoyl-CoA hydratase/carnithine racemase